MEEYKNQFKEDYAQVKRERDAYYDRLQELRIELANKEDKPLLQWVKCYDRLPIESYNYFTKVKAFDGNIYNTTTGFLINPTNNKVWATNHEVIEWLEETTPTF